MVSHNNSEKFNDSGLKLIPRILTQVCRDPDSPNFGSFDRNWWHYKIRSFPSIILQQGAYSLYVISKLPIMSNKEIELNKIISAACIFWNKRATKRGAFEEYYPWEKGYPPLAFSTLSIVKLVALGVVKVDEISPGLNKAANQLLNRFEDQALNQQIAGLAALSWIRVISPELIPESKFSLIIEKTLALQKAEGWFNEYGGPDLGYLSVSIDCLWELYDATGDEQFIHSAQKALKFIQKFVFLPSRGLGMHNARNTDYIVPYGISRFITAQNEDSVLALQIFNRIYDGVDLPDHFLWAIDDRYLCHYIGLSIFKTMLLTDSFDYQSLNEKKRNSEIIIEDEYLYECGYFISHGRNQLKKKAIISLKKGGVFTVWVEKGWASDYGWIVNKGKRYWCSHWWDNSLIVNRTGDSFKIKGFLTPYRETISTPSKHFVLNFLSFFFGKLIISILKNKLIFKKNTMKKKIQFERTINFENDSLVVTDKFFGLPSNTEFKRATRSSKRHVASANLFHAEDLTLLSEFKREEIMKYNNRIHEIKTTYLF